jgi:diguanylate cyclase (GGDEF)-like protein/PAS domain S-box-containing protein
MINKSQQEKQKCEGTTGSNEQMSVKNIDASFANIPDELLKKWQEMADLLADIINIPSALIMKTENEMMEVFISSQSENNPYHIGDKEKWHGLYCETVIKTQSKLLVPNAITDKHWNKNPDIKLGMIAYLGYPINFPNNRHFGTLCVLDNKENNFSLQQERILLQFKNIIEVDLAFLEQQSHLVNINKTLRESEAHWASLFNSMTNGFALHEVIRDTDGNIVDYRFLEVNPAFEKMTGIPREKWIDRRVKEVLPNVEDYWIENYAKVVTTGEPSNYENYATNLNRWFSTYTYRSSSEQFAVIVEDITERKLTEEVLHFHSNILNNIAEGVQLTRASDSTIVYTNPQFERLFGYQSGELLGKQVTIINAPGDKTPEEMANAIIIELARTGVWRGEIQNIKKDGTIFWCYANVSMFEHPKFGQVYVSLHKDITERKQIEKALQESELEFRTLAEVMPQIFWISRADGEPIYTNHQWTDYTGLKLEENKASNWIVPFHPDEQKRIQNIWQQAIQTGREYSVESRLRRFDGVYRWWLIRSVPLCDVNGKILKWFGTCTDIDGIKCAQNEVLATKNKLQATLDAIPDLFFELDFDGVYCDFRAPRTELLAVPPDQILGRNIADILPPDVVAVYWSAFREAQQQGWSSGKQIKLELVQGAHWFELSVAVKPADNEQTPHFIVLSRDITERKQTEIALKDSESKSRSIINLSPVPLALNDDLQNITFLNPAFIKTFGYDLNDIPTLSDWWLKAYPDPDYRQWVMDTWGTRIKQAEREQQSFTPLEVTMCCKDNCLKTVLISAAMISDTFSDVHLVVLYDITELKQAEADLRIAATVFEAQEGMLITDANQIILNVNQAFSLITGYSAAEVIGKTPQLLSSGQHNKAFYSALWASINDTGSWQGEIWNRRKNGEIYPEWLTITAVKGNQGKVTNYVATLTDITERKTTEERINRLAFYDPLTQLPNRRLLQERLKHSIDLSHRTDTQIAVLMLDLDKFKTVNDTLGHVAGDELLQQVAERIKSRLREEDTVARLGGDEFMVLIENVEHYEYVSNIADDIIYTLGQVFIIRKSHHVYISVSIGISLYPQHGDNVDTLMNNADAALYHIKNQSYGCFAYFSEDLTQKARERINLESRLRRAIEQQELQVYFQPQIDINSGQIVGAEALVRWHDPVYGLVMPTKFITLAEETGLIVPIGEWVLHETCRLGRQWLDLGLPTITLAVNVSPYQFRRTDINALVTKVLNDTGFPVDCLELEITESGLMENQTQAMNILNNLHNQGVRFAIDDFGTGYSSLAYLKYFPLDVLKIDKTFIDDIPFSQGDMAIASTIIVMAHHLGFKVLAEGVETKAQLAFLSDQGCDMYQGYLYSKPISADEFAKLLFQLGTNSLVPPRH